MDFGYIVLGGMIILVIIAGIRKFKHWDSATDFDGTTYYVDGHGNNGGVEHR